MFIVGMYERKELRTGIRAVERAPGVCAVYRRVSGRMRLVGAKLPGSFGTRTKIGRP